MKTAALVPARVGSEGIKNKNFKELAGKPLVRWTLDAAFKSGIFEKVIFSSDGGWSLIDSKSPKELDCIKKYNGILYIDDDRPKELSADTANLDAVLNYYSLKNPEIELWCLLQPTSPLRTEQDIKKAHKKVCSEKYDSLVSVTHNPGMLWVDKAAGIKGTDYPLATYHIHKRPNRQDRKDWYMENGAIYFTKKYVLEQMGVRLGGKIALYVMPKERSIEIDDMFDWELAEYFMAKRRK